MKRQAGLLIGVFFFVLVSQIQARSTLEEFGVLIKSATFWIGTPEEGGAMPYLKIPQGTKVVILAEEGKYFRINHKDLIGYVESKAVRIITPGEEEPKPASSKPAPQVKPKEEKAVRPIPPSPPSSGAGFYLVTERTSLRDGPDSQATVILRLPVDGKVEVLDATGKYWWKITYSGKTGWAKAALLRKE